MSTHSVAEQAPAVDSPYAIPIGTKFDGEALNYDLERAHNWSIGLCGVAGSGKTHLIRLLVRGYYRCEVTSYVLDVHGDLATIPGVPDEGMQTLTFGYRGGDTINPLRVTQYDGPYVVSRQFGDVVGLFAPSMGRRQHALLRRLVDGCFAHMGINNDDESSWSRRSPTLADLISYARAVLNDADRGTQDENTAKALRSLHKQANKAEGDEEYAEFCRQAGQMVFESMDQPPPDDDLLQVNKDRLASVIEILEEMQVTGLFGEDQLHNPRPGMVNRFDLTTLLQRDKQVVSYLLIHRVTNYMMRSATTLEPALPRGIMVIDEGKIVSAISTDRLSPLNRAATEGRKFGLGLVLGVQTMSHLTEDVIDSCGLFCVLAQHARRIKELVRSLGVAEDRVRALSPPGQALVNNGASGYVPVRINDE